VFFVDTLPMTGSGKVQKYLLRQEAEQRTAELVSAATS
jgi:acyl-coenzyme A synthetase/AMP-(fatty) acid ligase